MTSRRPNESYNDPYTDDTIPMRAPPRRSPVPPPPPQQPSRSPRAPRQPVRPPGAIPPPRPQRGRSIGSWLRLGMVLLAVATVLGLVGVLVFQQRVAGKVDLADVRQNRPAGQLLVQPMNVLLLGVDLRENAPEEGIRSDTMMLLHLDPAGGWASALSIPRDSVATIPGFGEAKINMAFGDGYNYASDLYGEGTEPIAGGAALAADTVEQFLNLPALDQRIDYVATINFNGFARMIDAIGGIEVDVPYEIVDTEYPTEDFGYTTITIPEGRQRFDGETALQYVRTRHVGRGDFDRAQRQQQVIQGIIQRLRDQPLPLRPISALRLVDAAGEATKTTLPVGRLDTLLMAAMVSRIDPTTLGRYQIDPENVMLEQEIGSDLYWNSEGIQALVREAFSPPGEAKEAATVQVQNGVGVAGVASTVTAALREEQFTLTEAADADATERSAIIDYGDNPITRARLSRVLGNMPVREGSSADAPLDVDIVVVLGSDYEQYWRP